MGFSRWPWPNSSIRDFILMGQFFLLKVKCSCEILHFTVNLFCIGYWRLHFLDIIFQFEWLKAMKKTSLTLCDNSDPYVTLFKGSKRSAAAALVLPWYVNPPVQNSLFSPWGRCTDVDVSHSSADHRYISTTLLPLLWMSCCIFLNEWANICLLLYCSEGFCFSGSADGSVFLTPRCHNTEPGWCRQCLIDGLWPPRWISQILP